MFHFMFHRRNCYITLPKAHFLKWSLAYTRFHTNDLSRSKPHHQFSWNLYLRKCLQLDVCKLIDSNSIRMFYCRGYYNKRLFLLLTRMPSYLLNFQDLSLKLSLLSYLEFKGGCLHSASGCICKYIKQSYYP